MDPIRIARLPILGLALALALGAGPAAHAQGGDGEVVFDELRIAPLMLSPGESAVLSFVDTLPRERAIHFGCDEKFDFFCPEPAAPVEVRLQLLDLSGAALASLQVFDKTTGIALASQGTRGSLRLHAELAPLPVPPLGGGPF
jgi:hypothetical protein